MLAAAPVHFRAMIIAALDTGMRRGEMLALRFGDVDWDRDLIVLRGATTKSRKSRVVPISTERLRAVLTWLRLDAEGEPRADSTLVFSDEIGDRLPHWHDTWLRTVLKAYGVKPKWSARLKYRGYPAESKAAYHRINLRWHDLRHQYASRLVEQGVPLAKVRDLLGHASITTSERYDNQKLENLQVAVTKLERGLAFSSGAASWTPALEPGSRADTDTDTQPRVALGRMPAPREPRGNRAGRRPISGGRSGAGDDPVTGPAVAPRSGSQPQPSGHQVRPSPVTVFQVSFKSRGQTPRPRPRTRLSPQRLKIYLT